MFKLLADSWCAERSFPKKTIPSSFLGEYQYCWIVLIPWVHILVTIACLKSFHVLQNQSFSVLFLQFCIFSNRNLQLVGNYIHKIVIKFAFCEISLPGTSRCVLIDISNLTHFLCCNLLVMSCLTPSAISANVLEIHLPITSIYPLLLVNSITNAL